LVLVLLGTIVLGCAALLAPTYNETFTRKRLEITKEEQLFLAGYTLEGPITSWGWPEAGHSFVIVWWEVRIAHITKAKREFVLTDNDGNIYEPYAARPISHTASRTVWAWAPPWKEAHRLEKGIHKDRVLFEVPDEKLGELQIKLWTGRQIPLRGKIPAQ
jgi:hypothetical protein